MKKRKAARAVPERAHSDIAGRRQIVTRAAAGTRPRVPPATRPARKYGGFVLLDHPSDIGVEAYGASLSEAFRYAALGLMSIILDVTAVRPKEIRMVNVEGADDGQMLVRWLSEILFLYDGLAFAVHDIRVLSMDHGRLAAEIRGEPFIRDRHSARLDVKAVTYHQLSVNTGAAGSVVRVFFDI